MPEIEAGPVEKFKMILGYWYLQSTDTFPEWLKLKTSEKVAILFRKTIDEPVEEGELSDPKPLHVFGDPQTKRLFPVTKIDGVSALRSDDNSFPVLEAELQNMNIPTNVEDIVFPVSKDEMRSLQVPNSVEAVLAGTGFRTFIWEDGIIVGEMDLDGAIK